MAAEELQKDGIKVAQMTSQMHEYRQNKVPFNAPKYRKKKNQETQITARGPKGNEASKIEAPCPDAEVVQDASILYHVRHAHGRTRPLNQEEGIAKRS